MIDIRNCNNFEKSFKQLEGLGQGFRFFQFSKRFQLYHNQLCQDSSVSFFGKANRGHLKMVNVNY